MYHSNIVFLVLVIIIHCQQYHHAHQEFVSQLFCIQHNKSIVLIPSDWDKTCFFHNAPGTSSTNKSLVVDSNPLVL